MNSLDIKYDFSLKFHFFFFVTYSRIFGLEYVRKVLVLDFFRGTKGCNKNVTCTITTSMGHNYLAIEKLTSLHYEA